MAAAMVGVMRQQLRCAARVEGEEPGRAVDAGRRGSKKVTLRQFRTHLMQDTIDAGPAKLDCQFIPGGCLEYGAIETVNDAATRLMVERFPMGAGVTPEFTIIEDDLAELFPQFLGD